MWLLNSSIGKKVVMSLTGLFLILFLTFHMSMNLVAIFSEEGYNMVCEFLGANWYALAGTLVLAAGVVIHFIYAVILTLENRKARRCGAAHSLRPLVDLYQPSRPGKRPLQSNRKTQRRGMGFSKYARPGYHRRYRYRHAPVPILVQNAVQRNYRYPSRGKSPRRICPYCRNTGKSYHGHHLSGMVRCYLVPPHTWLLERHSDIGLEQ